MLNMMQLTMSSHIVVLTALKYSVFPCTVHNNGTKVLFSAKPHQQQSMVIVPADSTGVNIVRPLTVFGADDAPVGHGEVIFDDVIVPKSNVILELGDGFKIAQVNVACIQHLVKFDCCFVVMQ